jgi:hypothetical protein
MNASTKAFFNARVSARARSTLECAHIPSLPHQYRCQIVLKLIFISPQSYRIQTANQLQFVTMIVGSMNSNKCTVSHVHSRANSKSSSIGS